MQKVEIVLVAVIGLIAVANAKPQFDLGFLSFKNGKIGVNFGGYHAEAGLGGILGGGRTAGGLSASAGTPFGANAQAGLGGVLDGNGYTGGGLHASAGLGHGNPQAAAEIGGELSGHGHGHGASFAGATAGGAGAAVAETVETHAYGVPQPSVVGKTVETQVYHSAPTVHVDKRINTHISQSAPSLTSKIVETHVFKAAPPQPEVVTVVDHVEKVKTKVTPKKQKTTVSTVTKTISNPSVESGVIVEKTIYPAANWNIQKFIETRTGPVDQVHYTHQEPIPASGGAGVGGSAGFYGGAFGGGYAGGYGGGYGGAGYGSNNYYVKPQPNPQLFDDIFNIPISTLTAVNQLLRNKGK